MAYKRYGWGSLGMDRVEKKVWMGLGWMRLCMGCVGKGMDDVGLGLVGGGVSYQLDQRLT